MSLRTAVRRSHQSLNALFETDLRDAKIHLTPTQFDVIEALSELENPSQTDLVEATGIDRSTMADIIRRLCLKGLVAKRRSPKDARIFIVTLTNAGKEVNLRAGILASTLENRVLDQIPAKGLEHKLKALITIAADTSKRAA